MVKRIVRYSGLLVFIMAGLSASAASFPDGQQKLLDNAGFTKPVQTLLLAMQVRLQPLNGVDRFGDLKQLPGISFEVTEDRATKLVRDYQKKLQTLGYVMFIQELGYGYQYDRIAVIKSNDKYDMLRVRKTMAYARDLSTRQIIQHLKQWEIRYGVTLQGAGYNWVKLGFDNIPGNNQAFIKELLDFCPSVATHASGDMQAWLQHFKQHKQIFLTWN